MEPHAELTTLLLKLFSERELRVLVSALPGGRTREQALPSAPESPAAFAHAVVALLERENRIDAIFFAAVNRLRPHRCQEIQTVAAGFGRGAMSVAPVDVDPTRLSITADLDSAHRAREEALLSGRSVEDLDARILLLRRQMRAGPSLHPGEEIEGRYRLIEAVGRGGFGTVWRAWDCVDREEVAVKVLHGQHAYDRSRIDRFFSGARQMAKLRHPSVARVRRERLEHDCFQCFVMDWYPTDLHRAVLAGLPQLEALRVVALVAGALVHAHERGLVHRDVKPHNILLRGRDVALADFDLVHAIDTTHGTRSQQALGTLCYAAPEMLDDASRSDARADVYGLGMTTLFCVLGRDLRFIEVTRDLAGMLARAPISGELRALIDAAVRHDREERTSSAAHFLSAVEGYLSAASARRSNEDPDEVTDPRCAGVPKVFGGELSESTPQDEPDWHGLAAGQPDAAPGAESSQPGETRAPVLPEHRSHLGGRSTVRALALILGIVAIVSGSYVAFSFLASGQPTAEATPRTLESGFVSSTPTLVDSSALQVAAAWLPLETRPAMVEVSPGSFVMGSPNSEASRYEDERAHTIAITHPFTLAATEVTNGMYAAVMGKPPAKAPLVGWLREDVDLPLQTVTWFEAVEYCNALSRLEGLTPFYQVVGEAVTLADSDGYRLPTEAEWEYAARAGGDDVFVGTSDAQQVCEFGNVADATLQSTVFNPLKSFFTCSDGFAELSRGGRFKANPWGFFDMLGNVSEWTGDWYGPYEDGQDDPRGPLIGTIKVFRGSSWGVHPRNARVAVRKGRPPGGGYDGVGFRLARTVGNE